MRKPANKPTHSPGEISLESDQTALQTALGAIINALGSERETHEDGVRVNIMANLFTQHVKWIADTNDLYYFKGHYYQRISKAEFRELVRQCWQHPWRNYRISRGDEIYQQLLDLQKQDKENTQKDRHAEAKLDQKYKIKSQNQQPEIPAVAPTKITPKPTIQTSKSSNISSKSANPPLKPSKPISIPPNSSTSKPARSEPSSPPKSPPSYAIKAPVTPPRREKLDAEDRARIKEEEKEKSEKERKEKLRKEKDEQRIREREGEEKARKAEDERKRKEREKEIAHKREEKEKREEITPLKPSKDARKKGAEPNDIPKVSMKAQRAFEAYKEEVNAQTEFSYTAKPQANKPAPEAMAQKALVKGVPKDPKTISKPISKTTSIKLKPTPIASFATPPFTFESEIKTQQINFSDAIKAKFLINNATNGQFDGKVLYKVMLLAFPEEKEYLLDLGFKSIKSKQKISISTKFSPDIPPPASFKFHITVVFQGQLIAEYDSSEIKVIFEHVEKYIRFSGLETLSNLFLPENPFVFWLRFTTKSFPVSQNLTLQASITAKNERLAEHTYNFQAMGPNKEDFAKKLYTIKFSKEDIESRLDFRWPFALPLPSFNEPIVKATLKVEIKDGANQTLYTKERPVLGLAELRGIRFIHVGYKRDVSAGENAYLVAEILNPTAFRIKGKAEFYFYSLATDEIKAFQRKFQIDPQNYEKIAEDIMVPEVLAGQDYWVICRAIVKTNKGKVAIEGLSKPQTAKSPPRPHFKAAIRAAVQDNDVFWNATIPIGIDVWLRTTRRLKNLQCEIVENYENISQRVLHRFKIKREDMGNSQCHWKVPSKYGKCVLDVRLLVNNCPVKEDNIEKEIPSFDLYPKPKKTFNLS